MVGQVGGKAVFPNEKHEFLAGRAGGLHIRADQRAAEKRVGRWVAQQGGTGLQTKGGVTGWTKRQTAEQVGCKKRMSWRTAH